MKKNNNTRWSIVKKKIDVLIDNKRYFVALRFLQFSGFNIEILDFGRIVQKIYMRADVNTRILLQKKIKKSYYKECLKAKFPDFENAISCSYIYLVLEEWELAYQLLATYKKEIKAKQHVSLLNKIIFQLLICLVKEKKPSSNTKALITQLSSDLKNQNIYYQFYKEIISIIQLPFSLGKQNIKNPLLNLDMFIDFMNQNTGIKNILSRYLPPIIYDWLLNREVHRNICNVKRDKPRDRPIRILIVSDLDSFLEVPIRVLKKAGYELCFATKSELFGDDVTIFNSQIYNLGPLSADKNDALKKLKDKKHNLINWCDIVFAEWLSDAAIWLSIFLPTEKILVCRLHSIEAFLSKSNFINMKGVDGMIFIADHIRKIFYRTCINAENFSHRHSIIQNIRQLESEIPNARSKNEKKTLCMVGYRDKNKDPVFALDLLNKLIEPDEDWRLKLIGHPLTKEVDSDYFEIFNSKLLRLNKNIDLIGYTNDVSSELKKCGFILSVSRREGSHESVIEAMSVGCIPIIRDWPLVKSFYGAKVMYPHIKLINDSDEAFSQIYQELRNFDNNSLLYRKKSIKAI